ncbi:MAG: 50S ribosomal protein L4 [Bacillota bacterium]
MPKVAIFNIQGQQVGEMDLDDSVFAANVNIAAMHQVVVNHLANRRRGTASVKDRGEVRGGGKKPWRQKGTGRARVGTIRSPLWRGGGITFGPQPRDYSYKLPTKLKRVAMRSALTSKVNEGKLIVLDDLSFNEPKTKDMVQVLKIFNIDGLKTLVVIPAKDDNITKSARNIKGVKPINVSNINVYDLLNHESLMITKDAVIKVQEVLANA